MDKISDTSHRYRQEILEHLFSALFYEMLVGIQNIPIQSKKPEWKPTAANGFSNNLWRKWQKTAEYTAP